MIYNGPMKSGLALACFVVAALPVAASGPGGKKPALELRSSPRFGFSPLNVLFVLELKGGDETEEYYCPGVEWFWDDGGKSEKEADCPPFEPGVTKIDRRFTAEHAFSRAGMYSVRVTLLHSGHIVAKQSTEVTVRPGLDDTQ